MEEARLIYSGVAHTVPTEPGRRLVCDIGGGSTELIIGEGNEPLELESLQMGCVSLSERFFSDGKLSAKRLNSARVAARLELEPIQAAYRRRGWQTSYGSSGTVRAIGDVLRELDPTRDGHHAWRAWRRSSRHIGEAGHVRELKFSTLTEDRRPVFPGGLAILMEVLSVLEIKRAAHRRWRDARGPAVRHGRATHGRGCARAHRARHAAPLSRGLRAGRTRGGHGAANSWQAPARPGSSPIRWRTWD